MKKKILWIETIQIKQIIQNSTSKKEVLETMGYNKGEVRHHNKLTQFIGDYNIDISHFGFVPEKWKELPNIINDCYSYADILRKLELSTHGSNTLTAKKYVQHFNLNVEHFDKVKGTKSDKVVLTDEHVFCKNKITKSVVRKRFLKLVEYKCVICGIDKWMNAPLILEMDHIDGNRDNNEWNNLRLLCPNCHSQTETFGSKNGIK